LQCSTLVYCYIITILIIPRQCLWCCHPSWQSHCESSPSSFDECRMAPSGRRPKTMPDDLSCESACTSCPSLHPPSTFIFYYSARMLILILPSTEGRRLSRPSCLATYRDDLLAHRFSPIVALTGPDVTQLR